MVQNIAAHGYIVVNNEAVWGYGATADEAWAMFESEMASNGVTVLGEDDSAEDQDGSWTRESDYSIKPASAALLQKIDQEGGNISWDMHGGVACTRDEVEAAFV